MKTAKLTGTVQGSVRENDVLRLERGHQNFSKQDGTLEYIASNCDKAHCDVEVANTEKHTITIKGGTGTRTFVNEQAIVKFTFKKGDAYLTIKSLSIGGYNYLNRSSASSTAYVALPGGDYSDKTITAVDEDNINYSCAISDGATLANGYIYNITVGMTQAK